MGQSVNENENGGGLMVALAQALMMNGYSDFKVAIFETLCAAAQWPSLKGRIAGSGVLGVITATLLSPRHPPSSKALMVRLCGLLATDSVEAQRLLRLLCAVAPVQTSCFKFDAFTALTFKFSQHQHCIIISYIYIIIYILIIWYFNVLFNQRKFS